MSTILKKYTQQISKWKKNFSLFHLAIGILCVIIVCLGTILWFEKRDTTKFTSQTTHTIILTSNGFEPKDVTIQKGESITFSSTTSKAFWPASDLHPSHLIYPEFDPKLPIQPDKSWSFTFNKVGSFNFHDHLFPLYRGTITVVENNQGGVQEELGDNCSIYNDLSKKARCQELMIDSSLRNKGLDQTFVLFEKMFQQDPVFAADCHGLAHKLGEQAYYVFSQNQTVNLTSKTAYCGYGFYHGFMETLIKKTNDMNQARAFCDMADQKLKAETSDAGGACYHGIGHGLVEDTPDPALWGKPLEIAKKGTDICEKVSINQSQLYRCTSGVFNALEIISDAKKYNLSVDPQKPFVVCDAQPEYYKEACYTQYVVAVMLQTANDFVKSAQLIDTIKEDSYALPTLSSLVVERVRLQKTDYQETVSYCHSLSARFQMQCIIAFGEGFLKYGPPQQEYVKAVDFCGSSVLNESEKTACFHRVLSLLRIFYPVQKAQMICQQVPSQYVHNQCQYN